MVITVLINENSPCIIFSILKILCINPSSLFKFTPQGGSLVSCLQLCIHNRNPHVTDKVLVFGRNQLMQNQILNETSRKNSVGLCFLFIKPDWSPKTLLTLIYDSKADLRLNWNLRLWEGDGGTESSQACWKSWKSMCQMGEVVREGRRWNCSQHLPNRREESNKLSKPLWKFESAGQKELMKILMEVINELENTSCKYLISTP